MSNENLESLVERLVYGIIDRHIGRLNESARDQVEWHIKQFGKPFATTKKLMKAYRAAERRLDRMSNVVERRLKTIEELEAKYNGLAGQANEKARLIDKIVTAVNSQAKTLDDIVRRCKEIEVRLSKLETSTSRKKSSLALARAVLGLED